MRSPHMPTRESLCTAMKTQYSQKKRIKGECPAEPMTHLQSWYVYGASVQFSSVQSLSRVQLFVTPWIAAHQASLLLLLLLLLSRFRPPYPSPTPGIHSNSCPSSRWCHPAISSSVVPFSSCPQSLPASESFPMSQLVSWGGQSTGVSALTSLLPKNTQDWSPSEWTGWISLQSKDSQESSPTTSKLFLSFCKIKFKWILYWWIITAYILKGFWLNGYNILRSLILATANSWRFTFVLKDGKMFIWACACALS